MDERILQKLSAITQEEQQFLDGRKEIDRSLYMTADRDMISGVKLLRPGKQMAVRPQTRFVHFPEHSHDYVEMVYMCRGQTTHIVNGTKLLLRQGELLLLGQNARQEVLRASREDIGVNFIVRPEFLSTALELLGSEETPLRRFLVACLCGQGPCGYLHFKVAQVKPVQNLVENLLWAQVCDDSGLRSTQQLTMGLLFVQLLDHTQTLSMGTQEQDCILRVLRYIEESYATATLTDIARQLHFDPAWLSRQIKRKTGKNFTQLLREKRMSQAAWLLRNTTQRVADISLAVGYENVSFFHRAFMERFGQHPRAYRSCK